MVRGERHQFTHEEPVALFEYVQRQWHAGKQHGAERKQRYPHGRGRQGTRGTYADRAMLTTIDLRGRAHEARRLLPRATQDVSAALGVVRPLCDDIRARGAAAVRDATARFDGVDVDELRVAPKQLAAALDQLDASVLGALEQAIARTRVVHEAQLPAATTEVEPAPGVHVAERWIPVNRVGLYVPGGNV